VPTVLVLDTEILWGGGDGVLEWLRDEEPMPPPTVVVANGRGCCRLPDRFHPGSMPASNAGFITGSGEVRESVGSFAWWTHARALSAQFQRKLRQPGVEEMFEERAIFSRRAMLVLSRKLDEVITIGDGVQVKVLGVSGNRVKLGICAPVDITIHRGAGSPPVVSAPDPRRKFGLVSQ
jgi:carbon storage regulator